MGILRFSLALVVLNWHYRYTNISMIFSFSAVCCFFIISGFYMALILNTKYEASARGLCIFYINRALRIYPIIIAIWLIYLLSIFAGFNSPVSYSASGWLNQILMFPHVVISNYKFKPLDNNLFFGQLSTVGLELMFYVLAPHVVRLRLNYLLLITILAAFLHYSFHFFGFDERSWQYQFFPGILYFFMLGAVSYRFFELCRKKWKYSQNIGWIFLFIFGAYCSLIYQSSIDDFTNSVEMLSCYLLLAAGLPFLYEASRNANWDRFLGDLSYPLYAVHFAVGKTITGKFASGDPVSTDHLKVLIASIAASLALNFLVQLPVERLRTGIASFAKAKRQPTILPVESKLSR